MPPLGLNLSMEIRQEARDSNMTAVLESTLLAISGNVTKDRLSILAYHVTTEMESPVVIPVRTRFEAVELSPFTGDDDLLDDTETRIPKRIKVAPHNSDAPNPRSTRIYQMIEKAPDMASAFIELLQKYRT